MYSHGFGTLFLAEAYGMTHRPEIREKLQKAVQLIIDTQNNEGGWRYQPVKHDADLSVTICQINALRAARNAGLYVPQGDGGRVHPVREAVAEPRRRLPLHALGRRRAASSRGRRRAWWRCRAPASTIPRRSATGIAYLRQFNPGLRVGRRNNHYFYGQYYAAQAMWIQGGDAWAEWYPDGPRRAAQAPVGRGILARYSVCNEYGTAMALIILQIPNNYLPIFQR